MLPEFGVSAPIAERALLCDMKAPEGSIMFVRSEDIPHLVEEGVGAVGITGLDYVVEASAAVKVVYALEICSGHVALQVPTSATVSSIRTLPANASVVTQYPCIAERAVARAERADITLVTIGGAAEAYVSTGLAAASIDVVSTGETARANDMKVVERLLQTSAVVISHGKLADVVFCEHIARIVKRACGGTVKSQYPLGEGNGLYSRNAEGHKGRDRAESEPQ
jgi:ATP phosphoribosyltransferase